MRRKILVIPALILALGALAMVGFAAAGAPGGAPAPTIQQVTLGKTNSAVAPGKVLLLNRRTFAPGADSGAHPAPGPVVLYVETGSVVFTVVKGAALVTPAHAAHATTLTTGNAVTLNAGDEVSYDAGVIHDVRNAGTVPAITLESRLNPAPAAPAA